MPLVIKKHVLSGLSEGVPTRASAEAGASNKEFKKDFLQNEVVPAQGGGRQEEKDKWEGKPDGGHRA